MEAVTQSRNTEGVAEMEEEEAGVEDAPWN